jgi:2-oxoglutarate dehydrogenase complex dehydrogenase (E1) component-like enzyme
VFPLAGLAVKAQDVAAQAEMYKTCAKHDIPPDKCTPKMYGQLRAQEQDEAPIKAKTTQVQVPVVSVQDAATLEEQYKTCAHHFIPADKCTPEIYRQLKAKDNAPLDWATDAALAAAHVVQSGLKNPDSMQVPFRAVQGLTVPVLTSLFHPATVCGQMVKCFMRFLERKYNAEPLACRKRPS